jgi:hypothetical protein
MCSDSMLIERRKKQVLLAAAVAVVAMVRVRMPRMVVLLLRQPAPAPPQPRAAKRAPLSSAKSMKVLQNETIEKELNYARQIKLDRADTRRKRKLWEP